LGTRAVADYKPWTTCKPRTFGKYREHGSQAEQADCSPTFLPDFSMANNPALSCGTMAPLLDIELLHEKHEGCAGC